MAEDVTVRDEGRERDARQSVGGDLLASIAMSIALATAAGPVCAVAGLLKSNPPTPLFSPGRYLLVNSAVCLITGVLFTIAWLPLIALTALVWRRGAAAVRRWSLFAAAAFLVLLTVKEMGLIPHPQTHLLVVALVWSLLSAHFGSATVRRAAFVLPCLYVMLYFADLANPFTMAVGAVAVLYVFRRYWAASPASKPVFESLGSAVLIAVVFAAGMHIVVGQYVMRLDAPYTLALLGVLASGFCIAGMIGLRVQRRGSPLVLPGWAAAATVALIAGGLLWAHTPPQIPQRQTSSEGRPNIVLIVWDTVRAQQLHEYGYERRTTPVFDRLASRGVLFEHAIAPGCWTTPSHASVFTGMPVRCHAACNGGYHKLASEYTTIAEVLSEAGYTTVGLTANHISAGRKSGFDQGFGLFLEPRLSAEWQARAPSLVRRLLWQHDDGAMPIRRALRRWLLTRKDPGKPFLLFVNLYEPHAPYTPPASLFPEAAKTTYAQAKRWCRQSSVTQLYVKEPNTAEGPEPAWQAREDLYDGEIRYVDRATGDIVEMLGLGDEAQPNTLLIVTSDHGENFGEHDLPSHMFSLHETLLHVPLALVWPGHIAGAMRVAESVTLTDLFATMLSASGTTQETEASGRESFSLLDTRADSSALRARTIIAEAWPSTWHIEKIMSMYGYGTPEGRFLAPLLAVYDGRWKYIRGCGQNRAVLYDLVNDPDERHDVSDERAAECEKLAAELDAWLQQTPNRMPTFADGYEKGVLNE